jgi:hypothetical protein
MSYENGSHTFVCPTKPQSEQTLESNTDTYTHTPNRVVTQILSDKPLQYASEIVDTQTTKVGSKYVCNMSEFITFSLEEVVGIRFRVAYEDGVVYKYIQNGKLHIKFDDVIMTTIDLRLRTNRKIETVDGKSYEIIYIPFRQLVSNIGLIGMTYDKVKLSYEVELDAESDQYVTGVTLIRKCDVIDFEWSCIECHMIGTDVPIQRMIPQKFEIVKLHDGSRKLCTSDLTCGKCRGLLIVHKDINKSMNFTRMNTRVGPAKIGQFCYSLLDEGFGFRQDIERNITYIPFDLDKLELFEPITTDTFRHSFNVGASVCGAIYDMKFEMFFDSKSEVEEQDLEIYGLYQGVMIC